MLKTSIILATFNRPELLRLGLESINRQKIDFPLEIVVVNDGTNDDTERVCSMFKKLDIKYVFSGSRNEKELISRPPSVANNIGIQQSTGDIIILSCPEIYHLNDTLELIIKPLQKYPDLLTIPNYMYFDDNGYFLSDIKNGSKGNLAGCMVRYDSVEMPFLFGVRRNKLFEIGGYDEDFIGYAADDNDLVNRLLMNSCEYFRVDAKIVHLYHGARCDSQVHWDDPKWVYNYNLFTSRKNIMVRNVGKDWGKIE
jgi:glycosyltransferase involved in cell wall biosynthesis